MLTNDLEIKKVEITTHGRKAPLKEIRENMLKKHSKYLRATRDQQIDEMDDELIQAELERLNELTHDINTNDSGAMRKKLKELERTRHLMVWLDNSTVANSGYLVCLVTCLYDPAVFYTTEEYKEAFGKTVNIQKIIEEPEIHFIAKCGSSDCELLLYSEERMRCISELKINCIDQVKNIEYVDKMRFCHGDMPLRAFECGHQKGGNFFCSACGIHCDMTYHLDHALDITFESLEKKQNVILQGAVAARRSRAKKPKPFKDLSIGEIKEELGSRGIYDGNTKKELEDLLTEHLQGKQRVPALLINTPEASLSTLGLANYEVLPCEPLHDIGHHIENFFTEFPKHLSPDESKVITEAIALSLKGKESKRCVDYRIALIKTASIAHQSGVVSPNALLTLDSLVEMQRILYSDDNNRSVHQLLRYYNQAWYHGMLLYDYITSNPKKLTLRKMFGVYFHNLTAHAGDMLRIISGQSANAERQERIFNSIKRITKNTSNYHSGHIVPNLFIRLQAEKEMGLKGNDVQRQQAHVANLSKSLPKPVNTLIPISFIKKHPREWQAHLQHISDFLLEGEGVWWSQTQENIEFYDVSKYPDPLLHGPAQHHFRSSNLKRETDYMKSCWEKCIEEKKTIPIHEIRTKQPDGKVKKIHTAFLANDDDNVSVSENANGFQQLVIESNHNDVDPINENNDFDDPMNENYDYDDPMNENIPNNDYDPLNENNYNDDAPIIDNNDTNQEMSNEEIVDIHLAPSEVVELEEIHVTVLNQNENSEIQSRLGKALKIVLGNTQEVHSLDKKYTQLKELKKRKTTNLYLQDNYEKELSKIQSQVLAKNAVLETKLKEWEKNYVFEHNFRAPSLEEMKNDKVASSIIHQKSNTLMDC